jgi:hypothetical protein
MEVGNILREEYFFFRSIQSFLLQLKQKIPLKLKE